MRCNFLGWVMSGCLIAAPALAAESGQPTVLELFQSEGCSSCPPAEAVLGRIADRPDVIALSFEVTYWDRLGWTDRFGDAAFTQRQYDYAAAINSDQVYTPQMIVNGRGRLVGTDPAEVDAALGLYARADPGPAITVAGGAVTIGTAANAGGPASVWLVRYDPRTIAVPVESGENGGRTLTHRNLVRALVKLGAWDGQAQRFTLPPGPPGLATAILVQTGTAGPIVAARRL
jgi:hypothetical protein